MTNIDVDSFKLVDTPVSEIQPKLEKLRKFYASHKTKDVAYRKTQLLALKKGILSFAKEMHRTNYLDLGFSEFNSHFSVVNIVLSDLEYIINNFESWAKETETDTPLLLAPAKSLIRPEPYGVCLIFSAWNSQYQTLLQPMAAAIAAGNVVLAKPSEMAPFSACLFQHIFKYLDDGIVEIVQGGADQCIELTGSKTDIIVFTGSPQKGRLVAKAAAAHLIPCILELGGQNPVIVDETADIKCAAYNLVNGRFVISGQACIAPEYVMVKRKIFDTLCENIKDTVNLMFTTNPKNSKDYCRIINEWHTDRLNNLLNTHGGEVVVSNDRPSIKEKFIPPTVIKYKSMDDLAKSSLAKEEIFGPILYLAPYDDLKDCIDFINARDKPLAMYYFGFDKTTKEEIKSKTSSGALVINDTIVHFANHYLPFGGVGNSGYSAYHGKYGFDALSHQKPILDRSHMVVPIRYPPFTSGKESLMRKALVIGDYSQKTVLRGFIILMTILSAYIFRSNLYAGLQGLYYGPKY